MKRMITILLVASMAVALTACTENTPAATAVPATAAPATAAPTESIPAQTEAPVPSALEQIKNVLESTNIKVDGLNAYNSSFDEVVTFLKSEGVIADDADGIDMNETAGYVRKYDGTMEEVMAFCDKAVDYNGVGIVWFDLLGNTQFMENYNAMESNSGTIPIRGGMYTVSTNLVRGSYALVLGESLSEEAKAAAMAALQKIDNTKTALSLYNEADIARALQKAKVISVQELAADDSVNDDYTYIAKGKDWVGFYNAETNPNGTESGYTEEYDKTFNVTVASAGHHYGKITLYYFNTTDSGFGYTGAASTYADLVANQAENGSSTASLYYDPDNDGTFEAYPDVTLSVDYLIGNFAVSVNE